MGTKVLILECVQPGLPGMRKNNLCTTLLMLNLFPVRVKLKHFEKFQDTTEALAGMNLFTGVITLLSLCVLSVMYLLI